MPRRLRIPRACTRLVRNPGGDAVQRDRVIVHKGAAESATGDASHALSGRCDMKNYHGNQALGGALTTWTRSIRHSGGIFEAILKMNESDTPDPSQALIVSARELVYACILALAGIKNVALTEEDATIVAYQVTGYFRAEELAIFLNSVSERRPCKVVEAANRDLDRLAALQIIRTFERVGAVAPMSRPELLDTIDDMLSDLPLRTPGAAPLWWPNLSDWEEMAAARFQVAPPADLARFGALITRFAGRA